MAYGGAIPSGLKCLSAAAHDPKSAGTPMAVISTFCQCSAVAIVRLLTPVEIFLAVTNGGKTVPDEKVQAAAELCVDTVRKAQQRRRCASVVRLPGDGLDVPPQSADALATDQFAVWLRPCATGFVLCVGLDRFSAESGSPMREELWL